MTGTLPELFTERMKRMLGAEYDAFLASYDTERALGLRINPLKGDAAELFLRAAQAFHLKKIPWAENGWYYEKEDRPGKHPFHEAGLYYIQEPSAMSVVELLAPEPGDLVLDLCAAPGGKTTQAAGRLLGQGLLVSNEIHPARAKILAQNVERMGAANVVVTNHDSAALRERFPEFFDRIIVDAPCSGEGMFRKDENARAEWSPDNVRLCSERQKEILDNAAAMLKSGGYLVYSTCTFAPEENEGSVLNFLRRHPEFSLESRALPWFDAGCMEWGSATGIQSSCPENPQDPSIKKTVRIWPHKVEGEGHFLALLKKEKQTAGQTVTVERPEGKADLKKNRDRIRKNAAGELSKEQNAAFLEFCEGTLTALEPGQGKPERVWEQQPGRYLMFGEQYYYVPADMPDLKGLKVLRPGLHLGTFKKNRFEPSHALALYLKKDQVKASADFGSDSQEILKYLKGETLNTDAKLKGWTLVTVDGYSLGWGKAAGGVLKNHYPKGLRWS